MTVLAKASPSVVKKLRAHLKPQLQKSKASAEICILGYAHDWGIDHDKVSLPNYLGCCIAYPHTDWDSYFIGVNLFGKRTFCEATNETDHRENNIQNGDIFVVDGSKKHWLQGQSDSIPRGWWAALQWEVDKALSMEDQREIFKQIFEVLDANRIPSSWGGRIDERYLSWLT